MSKKIKIELVKSKIGTTKKQQANLLGLGLKRVNQQVTLENTACVRGMIRKVQHLISIEIN